MIDCLNPDFKDLPGRRKIPAYYRRGTQDCEHLDVSVITPYYNTGNIFVETFNSIISQSLQNWEWIIVDDGSTDREALVRLNNLAAQDDRIKVIHQENGGTAKARNTGIRESSGRYFCLLDHDDMLEHTYLEKCAWFLDSNREFAFCNSYSVVFDEQEFLWTTGYERGKEYFQANSAPPISVVSREAFEICGGFDETIRVLYEDWDFWLAMAKAGYWGYTIPEYLQWYRKLGAGRYEQIMESGYDNEDFAREMQQKYPGLEDCFPDPRRRQLEPYESINTVPLICNPLSGNPDGRRIMFLIPWMVIGGADRVNLQLLAGLTARGHQATVCATLPADHRWEHQFSIHTPDIFILPNFLHRSDYPRFLDYLIKSRKIDTVVVSGSTIGYQLLAYLRASSENVAFIDLSHVEELHWQNGGHPRFGVGYQDVLDLNIVTTKYLARWMTARGADASRIRVMYTGVHSGEAGRLEKDSKLLRAELDIPADIPVLVFSGRLCDQKRPALLAKILHKVQNHGLRFFSLIIGDGELRGELEILLEKYQLSDNVRMLGTISHEKWLDVLIVADMLLMPSLYEGISIAFLEAIASGVVPIAARVGGHGEVIDDDAGFLISPGKDELQEYVNAICGLLTDRTILQEMSKKCMAIADSRLSQESMNNTFAALIEEAHQLKKVNPRNPISFGLGVELATQALECNRLGDVIHGLSESLTCSAESVLELRSNLAEKERFLSNIVNSQRWRLINLLSAPYRKLKERFLG